jgi:hypothetical protein
MSPTLGLVFTIDVDGRPTVAFEAMKLPEAYELCNEDWFRADLTSLNSDGAPLCRVGSKLKARMANSSEIALYREAANATRRPTIFFWFTLSIWMRNDTTMSRLLKFVEQGPHGEKPGRTGYAGA